MIWDMFVVSVLASMEVGVLKNGERIALNETQSISSANIMAMSSLYIILFHVTLLNLHPSEGMRLFAQVISPAAITPRWKAMLEPLRATKTRIHTRTSKSCPSYIL